MLKTAHEADIISDLRQWLEVEAPARRAESLSTVERQIVAVARFDPISSLRTPSRRDRLVAWLFGVRRPNALADPRLESLRRFAVLGWQGARVDLDAFLASGYSIAQADAVQALIEAGRPRKAGHARWIGALLVAALGLGATVALQSYFIDWLVALLLALVVLLSAMPILGGAKPARA